MQGAQVAFPSIVAFGENAAIPHHMTGDTRLNKIDVVLIDFGARWKGYNSDCTRTHFVGKVPKKWKKIYETVKASQQAAIDYISKQYQTEHQVTKQTSRSNKKAIELSDVDKVARNYITTRGYPTIPHSLGHGIGLEVHESPSLSPQSKDILQDGMVFSIEPGIYLPGEMGVRIEDLATIQNGKLLLLT